MNKGFLKATGIILAIFGIGSASAVSAEESMFSTKSLTPEVALELAQEALANCRKQGYQVAVSVVDRAGNLQVTLRDRFAGPHTPETSRGKAWSAVSFRSSTLEITKLIKSGELPATIGNIPGATMVGGGLPVEAAGSIVAGIGVSGAPGGTIDEACAKAGIEVITDKIAF